MNQFQQRKGKGDIVKKITLLHIFFMFGEKRITGMEKYLKYTKFKSGFLVSL